MLLTVVSGGDDDDGNDNDDDDDDNNNDYLLTTQLKIYLSVTIYNFWTITEKIGKFKMSLYSK